MATAARSVAVSTVALLSLIVFASNTVQWPKLPGYTYLWRAISSRRKEPRQDAAHSRQDRRCSAKITARRAEISLRCRAEREERERESFLSEDGKNRRLRVCVSRADKNVSRVFFFLLLPLVFLSGRRSSTHVVLRLSLRTYLRSHKILKANATRGGRIVRELWIKARAASGRAHEN